MLVVTTITASISIVVLLIATVYRIHINQQVKALAEQNCQATLVALREVKETAAAGIRPVASKLPPGFSENFRKQYEQQKRATIAENSRRRKVIADVEAAAKKLGESPLCN